MSTATDVAPAITADRGLHAPSDADRGRTRRRAMRVLTGISLVSVAVLAYLLVRGHTAGEQIWGPITAGVAAITGALSLAYLGVRGHSKAASLALAAAWLAIAVAGYGGYQSHRLAYAQGAGESGEGPSVMPLVLVGFAIAGTVSVRAGSKEK